MREALGLVAARPAVTAVVLLLVVLVVLVVRRRVRGRGAGWVYAIGCGEHIKIGLTTSTPQHRLKQLQTGQPEVLELLCAWRTGDPPALEAAMHHELRDRHYRGEWFSISLGEAREAYRRVSGRSSWLPVLRWGVRRRVVRVWRLVVTSLAVLGGVSLAAGVVLVGWLVVGR